MTTSTELPPNADAYLHITKINHSEKTSASIGSLFKIGLLTDVTLKVGELSLKCHRLILSSRW